MEAVEKALSTASKTALHGAKGREWKSFPTVAAFLTNILGGPRYVWVTKVKNCQEFENMVVG